MFLFVHHPREVFAAGAVSKRSSITIKSIELTDPIGIALGELCTNIGVGASIDMFHFPVDYQGDYIIPGHQPNDHFYQILGMSRLDGAAVRSGDVHKIENPTVTITPFAGGPNIFVRIHLAAVKSRTVHDPRNVEAILLEDYLSPKDCQAIIDSLHEGEQVHYGHVLTDPKNNITKYDPNVRQAKQMITKRQKMVRRILREIITDRVEPFFKTKMDFWNWPVLLKYETGGFDPHVDGEAFDATSNEWYRIYDRDYTLVAFLNDDYEGGNLIFPDLDFKVTPKQGQIVAFPGSHIFRHGAEKTTKGTRYQLVSWLTEVGTPRTNIPPNPAIIFRDK